MPHRYGVAELVRNLQTRIPGQGIAIDCMLEVNVGRIHLHAFPQAESITKFQVRQMETDSQR